MPTPNSVRISPLAVTILNSHLASSKFFDNVLRSVFRITLTICNDTRASRVSCLHCPTFRVVYNITIILRHIGLLL